MLVEEKSVNEGVGLVTWTDIPLDVKESLLDHLRVWCDNMEVYFDYGNMHLGLWVPQDEGQDELLDWGDLTDMGLVFALGYVCLMRESYIPVGITGVSVGIWVGRNESYYDPENINSWIQVLRRFGFQVEGLTK